MGQVEMLITWSTGQLELTDAWVSNKTEVNVETQRTISGDVIVYLPASREFRIIVNRCTYEDASVLKDLALAGETVDINDDGFLLRGKLKSVKLYHLIEEIKESAVRQRLNLYRGEIVVEGSEI